MRRGNAISGVVSLVMIFSVLCMAIFAALSLSTAQREERLADLTAQRAEAYFQADRTALRTLAALGRGEKPEGVTIAGDRASFTVPAGGELVLSVRLAREGTNWTIRQWKTVYAGDWQTKNELEVWDGEAEDAASR